MNISIHKQSGIPIYEQIVSEIKRNISQGLIKAEDQLPSIRLLAKDLGVSVITTKRAYEDLEREGLIYSQAGKGTFVSNLKLDKIQGSYQARIKDLFREVAGIQSLTGLSKEEIIVLLEEELK